MSGDQHNDYMSSRYPQWVLVTSLLATFLTVLNSSMVNIALPTLMNEFNIPIDLLTWIVTGYMLPYAVLMPLFGQLGDIFGRRRIFIIGLSIFISGSVVASFANGFPVLLLARVIQAIGASSILPNGMALVTNVFPAKQRGKVLGIWGAVAAFGAVIGPTVGGYLVQYASWRAIFYFNIPFGLICLALCIGIIKEIQGSTKPKAFDLTGAVTLSVSIFALMLAVTQLEANGLFSPIIIGLVSIFIFFFSWFFRTERRIASPMVDLSLFQNRTFVSATLGGFIQMFSIYAVVLPIPIFLQQVQGFSTSQTGLFLVSYSLTQTLASPVGGWLVDRIGKRIPAMGGMILCTTSFFLLTRINLLTPPIDIIMKLVVGGMGIGLMTSSLTNGIIDASPAAKIGVSSGIYNMVRFMGSVFSAAILGSVLQSRSIFYSMQWTAAISDMNAQTYGLVRAFPEVFMLTTAVTGAGVLILTQIRNQKHVEEM